MTTNRDGDGPVSGAGSSGLGRLGLITAGALLLVPWGAGAQQELPVRTAVERPPVSVCESRSAPARAPGGEGEEDSLERHVEAARLAASAAEATAAGDHPRARELLLQASERDPDSPELAMRLARVHEKLEETKGAVAWYCRYLELASDGAEAETARSRARELALASREPRSGPEEEAFRAGVEKLLTGEPEEAEERFSEALRMEPDLPDAFYNRGLARGSAGRADGAVDDLRAYLRARPDAPDRERVRDAIGFLERGEQRYSPTSAMTLGAVLPGAGHFYTGQPFLGVMFLGLAAGAGVTAALYERIEVECRSAAEEGPCPENHVVSRSVERPALVPGIAAAALTAAVSAFTAYRSARARNDHTRRLRVAGPESSDEGGRTVRLFEPASAPFPGGSALALLQVRF